MSSNSTSSLPSYKGSPNLSYFAKSLFDTLEKERKPDHKKPPDELLDYEGDFCSHNQNSGIL